MNGALRHYDIDEYVRASTRLSARYADTDETRWLSLAPGAIVTVVACCMLPLPCQSPPTST